MMKTVFCVTFAATVAGCCFLPEVGPDYEEPEFRIPDRALPDAGLPTTKLTEVGEYRPADGADS